MSPAPIGSSFAYCPCQFETSQIEARRPRMPGTSHAGDLSCLMMPSFSMKYANRKIVSLYMNRRAICENDMSEIIVIKNDICGVLK